MGTFQIPEFYGIQQHKAGVLLDAGTCSDCRNVDTLDGNLKVGKGYRKLFDTPVPGTGRVLKLVVARGVNPAWYVICADGIYFWDAVPPMSWDKIHTFSPELTGRQIDYLQVKIGQIDYIVVATGETQMLKINLSTNAVTNFGEAGSVSVTGIIDAYDHATKTVTLPNALTDEQARRTLAYGITIGQIEYPAMSASGTTVVLVNGDAGIQAGDAYSVRSGGSDAKCNFCDLFYSRLMSAGDSTNPCRLYWSAVPGDGRSIEDWLVVDADADASGGYVQVGESSGDPIIGLVALSDYLLIFKRFSIYRMYGSKPSNYTLERIEWNTEQTCNSGVLVFTDNAFWPTRNGIQYYTDETIQAFDGGVRMLKDFLSGIYSWAESKSCACDNVWYFTCKSKSTSTYDDTILVYDSVRKAFTVRDGFEIADILHHDGRVYLVDGDRYLCQWGIGQTYCSDTNGENGTQINAYWVTQVTDLQNKRQKKQVKQLFMQGESGKIMVDVHSGGTMQVVDRILDAKVRDGFIVIPVSADRQRTFYFRFYNEAGSYFNIIGGIEIAYESERGY